MLTQKDWLLVANMRQNSRENLTTISRRTGIPVSTIYDHVRQQTGLLYIKHVALLNFGRLGFGTKVYMLIRTPKQNREHLQTFLELHWNVNTLFKVNNGYDFGAECVFKDVSALEEFLHKLEDEHGVKELEVHYVLEELKREAFLADPATVQYVANERNAGHK